MPSWNILEIFKTLNWLLNYPYLPRLGLQIMFLVATFNKILNIKKVICMNPLVSNLIAFHIIHLIMVEKSKHKISTTD